MICSLDTYCKEILNDGDGPCSTTTEYECGGASACSTIDDVLGVCERLMGMVAKVTFQEEISSSSQQKVGTYVRSYVAEDFKDRYERHNFNMGPL